ncbi:MAG: phosphoenolpyruvate carboxykinase (GTP) [Clostridia bacterium]|nr:phosphoenolpyruvate carboxykinase (GTP) [Clostridia bacterium]MBQ2236817.1 phosphoenolpyruvate carboxykinase (GTP) [Clostridia bacterium]MEE1185319.1 phosphoenolpyruvate carboxykinase (GTP) [Acutalibacteraceae bacterium]
MTQNKTVIKWLDEMKSLVNPDNVVWIDGSEEQIEALRAEAVKTGEMIKLNEEKLPGCYLHRTNPNDVARVEDRTFICSREKENAGPTNNWCDPKEMYEKLYSIAKDSYKGRTMYIIPYSMGPIGSPIAKVGIEVTDSIYVVLNMVIMTRVSTKVLDVLGDSNDWVRGLHCRCDIDPENRYICHFPEDNTIISVNSGYGGNVLLGKKCFALRIASYQGWKEGWMAEHMLILGLENPKGEVKYIAAAFPSACGKTNLAMLIPPEYLRKKGYKIWTVGDDISWMKIGPDGRLYAINPENGFFGVAPGTNAHSNFNALESTKKNTIFTNVCLNLDDNTVWWEGLDKNPPENALEWKGNPWNPSMFVKADKSTYAAHPNSRFTAPAKNCPCISEEFDKGAGVPISAIVFGGRRAKCAPLVYQSKDWVNGVFVGSAMASETTAAAAGAVGVVRRDPMAMLPFCGYHMGDYFTHWLEMGEKLGDKAPKIFNVNWFRTDDEGNFIWPGFGDNMRVLNWIIDRCEGKADATETAIGYVPKPEDIDLTDLDMDIETLKDILEVDKEVWTKEAAEIEEHYKKFGDRLPEELREQLNNLKENLAKM